MAASAIDRAVAAYGKRSWAAAATAFAEADADGALPPADLERWGLAAYLAGLDEQSEGARERAHHAYLAGGQPEAAARVGHWLAVSLVLHGEPARAGGWFARVRTVLDEHQLGNSIWHLYLRVSAAMQTLFGGDAAAAAAEFERILADAEGREDPDLYVLIRNGLGQSLVASGRVDAGLRRLDEVMVGVTSNDAISPQVVGLMYCAVIDACRRSFDLRRAHEWTHVLSRWCAHQDGLVPYRGQCLVHRAEILQLHGSWRDAQAEVERVFALLGEDPTDMAAGMAHYQRGELHRLRGEYDVAEECYRKAARCGHDPQPGLALLRAAQGRSDDAAAALRRALQEASGPNTRLRLLPAQVSIALTCGDEESARPAAAELRKAAEDQDAPLLSAAAATAEGQVALAVGDASLAVRLLRQALLAWQQLGAPYDAAMTRVQLASACRALGDEDTAELELDAASWAFENLGAAPDLARVGSLRRQAAPPPVPGGLTPREVQILQLVATGATNRAIAADLFLSEKTVARHVANVFLKLQVTTRAAATAYAYENALV